MMKSIGIEWLQSCLYGKKKKKKKKKKKEKKIEY